MTSKRIWILVAGILVVSGCGKSADRAQPAAQPRPAPSAQVAPTINELMTKVVVPQSAVLWGVSNAAQDNDGNVDASKVTNASWLLITDAAMQMKEASEALGTREKSVVAASGVVIQDANTASGSSAAQVQGFIDAAPAAFRDRAGALAVVSDQMVQAAATHNAGQLGAAAAKLDEVCEQCHVQFWYPQQMRRQQ